MAKTKFTRENVRSDILKKVIIKVDYQGFSGADDTGRFITSLKPVWVDYFHKYSDIPNKNFNVNLGKSGLTNFSTEIIHVHRFSSSSIGSSQAVMDITAKFASIEVTCSSPYEGSDGYLDCMAHFIKILKDYDPFVELTRIGIRKIDHVFNPSASELDNILESNVWNLYQDIPRIIAEKKEYKDFIKLNNGTLVNLARILEKVMINNNEQYRLTFDADAYKQNERLDNSGMRNIDVNKHMLSEINEPLFFLFIKTFKEDFINNFYNG